MKHQLARVFQSHSVNDPPPVFQDALRVPRAETRLPVYSTLRVVLSDNSNVNISKSGCQIAPNEFFLDSLNHYGSIGLRERGFYRLWEWKGALLESWKKKPAEVRFSWFSLFSTWAPQGMNLKPQAARAHSSEVSPIFNPIES